MNDDSSSSNGGILAGPLVPILLLSITFIVLLIWQINLAHSQSGQLASQHDAMENAITRQTTAVNQAHQLESSVEKLANDLIDAAKTDDAAKAIAAKYIRNNSATPAASPAQ
jgi:hypothetical protein